MSLSNERKKELIDSIQKKSSGVDFVKTYSPEELAEPLNDEGDTALHLACELGDEEKALEIIAVLDKNAASAAKTAAADGWTPFHLAARYGSVKLINTITQILGTDVTSAAALITSSQHWTVLHAAAKYNSVESLEAIITALGEDAVDIIAALRDSDGFTLLHLVGAYSSEESIQALIAVLGIDVEDQLKNNCPLHDFEKEAVREQIEYVIKEKLFPKLLANNEDLSEKQMALCFKYSKALKEVLFANYGNSEEALNTAIDTNTKLGRFLQQQAKKTKVFESSIISSIYKRIAKLQKETLRTAAQIAEHMREEAFSSNDRL